MELHNLCIQYKICSDKRTVISFQILIFQKDELIKIPSLKVADKYDPSLVSQLLNSYNENFLDIPKAYWVLQSGSITEPKVGRNKDGGLPSPYVLHHFGTLITNVTIKEFCRDLTFELNTQLMNHLEREWWSKKMGCPPEHVHVGYFNHLTTKGKELCLMRTSALAKSQ